jgi:hypothetical protein
MMLTNCLLRTESLLAKLDSEGVVIVASANNHAQTEGTQISRYPAKFADPSDKYGGLANMVVVSATNWKTQRADFAQYATYITTFAPGNVITCPNDPFLGTGNPYRPCDGTSYGKSAALVNLHSDPGTPSLRCSVSL